MSVFPKQAAGEQGLCFRYFCISRCWEGLGAGGEGDDRRWDGWMASPTRCTWVWVNSRSWWWTGRPGMLWFIGSQSWTRLNDWTELNWTEGLPKCLTLKKWMLNAYREKQCTVQKGPWSLFYFYFPKPHKYLSKIWLYF